MRLPLLMTAALGAALCAMPVGTVRADTVLMDTAGFIEGAQSFVESMQITAPGTLTVTLADVPWLDTIADLSCFFTTTSNVLGAPMGIGSESMAVMSGTIYAHWYGTAAGTYNLGAYTMNVTFSPNGGGATAVGLPGSLFLLLSGLGLLMGWQRRGPTPPPLHDEALTI